MSDYFNGKADILESIAKIQSDLGVLHYQIRNWKIDQSDLYCDMEVGEFSAMRSALKEDRKEQVDFGHKMWYN